MGRRGQNWYAVSSSMNVLCHGAPFCADWPVLDAYRGPHTIRRFGPEADADIRYDPATEDAPAIAKRVQDVFPVDLALFWTPDIYPPPDRIEDAPWKTAALISDWNVSYDLIAMNIGRYDVVCCDAIGADRVLNRFGIQPHYVTPLYCAHPVHHRQHDLDRDIDVMFIGTFDTPVHEKRNQLLARIAAWDTDAKILIGSGFDWDAYGALLNRARIVVNHSIRGELNLRVFESMACGAMPMIEEGNAGVHQWFTPGEDIVTYDPDTILETIEYYLRNEDDLAAVTKRAHARAEEWSGAQRLDTVVEFCAATETSGRPFGSYDTFSKTVNTWRQYAGARDERFVPLEEKYARKIMDEFPQEPAAPFAEAMTFQKDDHAAMTPLCYEAHRRDRNNIAFAMNASMAFGAIEKTSMEERCLRACLDADGMDHAGLMLGEARERFPARWRRALAEGSAAPAMAHAEAHYRLARIAVERGAIDEAETALNMIDELDPQHGEYWGLRFAIHRHRQEISEAAQALRTYIDYHPLDIGLRERLADVLEEAGNNEEADRVRIELNRMRSRIIPPKRADGSP